MFLFLRFLPFNLSIINGALLLLLFWYPRLVSTSITLTTFFLVITLYLLIYNRYRSKPKKKIYKIWALHSLLPLLFHGGIILFLFFINNVYTFIGMTALYTFLLFIYTEDIYIYLYHPNKYVLDSLENIAEYLAVFTLILITASFYGFMVFIKTSIITLLIALIVITGLLVRHMLFINKIKTINQSNIILMVCMGMTQLFIAIALLPSSIYVNALMIGATFYAIMGIIRLHLLNMVDAKKIRSYLILAALIITIVCVTAQWT